MSTKITICHGEQYHLYQEVCDTENVYLRLDHFKGDFSFERNQLTLSLSPALMTEIAQRWLENKDKFDDDPECEINLDIFKG